MGRRTREMKPSYEASCALAFIQGYALDVEQVKRRYTVLQIDNMCYELGLAIIDGEVETQKARRLLTALGKAKYPVAPALPLDVDKEITAIAEAEKEEAAALKAAEKAAADKEKEDNKKAEEAAKAAEKAKEEQAAKAEEERKAREARNAADT